MVGFLSISFQEHSELPAMSFEELKNFDFGFDEERDSFLIAKNAFKIYSNDKVSFFFLFHLSAVDFIINFVGDAQILVSAIQVVFKTQLWNFDG